MWEIYVGNVVARDKSPNRRFLYAQFITEGVHRSNIREILTSSAAVLHLVKKQTHHYPLVTLETTMFATYLDTCYPLLCFLQKKKKKWTVNFFSWKLHRKH
jgi:hypothetical protein